MQERPSVPGIERTFATTPTTDTERNIPFLASRDWKPDQISIFGHKVSVDLTTGNLIVTTTDISYLYYNFSLAITRRYDTQEQHMQLSYYRNYANINPKPHWFGNWQFAYEADVEEVWHNSYPELELNSGIGANGLFEIKKPDFKNNINNSNFVSRILNSYGIPSQTLENLNWNFKKNDFLLRTLRGSFQILCGHFYKETFVDDIDAKIWLFNTISGSSFRINSDYFYNISQGDYRDVGFPLIVTKLTDAVGHSIELKPSTKNPPFQEYILSDDSGREFHIELDEPLTYLDGLSLGRKVRSFLVSKITDHTKSQYNQYFYEYTNEKLLKKITFPCSIKKADGTEDENWVKYHYENTQYPGILTSIEDRFNRKVLFEYIEDPIDNDDRFNPRLKIKKIIIPNNIIFEYNYRHSNSEVIVTISKNGTLEREIKYYYTQDVDNTKRRYITLTEIRVQRGYFLNLNGNSQLIRSRTEYTSDGRYNIRTEIDPLNRKKSYVYNDFNQITEIYDFDNHWTKYYYDINENPTPDDPHRYDLLKMEQQNIMRGLDIGDPLVINDLTIIKQFEYDKYNVNNSSFSSDYNMYSTHRVHKIINERNKIWTYTYDDVNNHCPIAPTSIESPIGNKTDITYSNRGEQKTVKDAENNVYTYNYWDQSTLKEYIDPNNQKITLTYYDCRNWIHKYKDQRNKIMEFLREADGRINKIIDFVGDEVEYEYLDNGRLTKIIKHRHAIPQDPAHPDLKIEEFLNLETEIEFTALGKIQYLKDPKGLELILGYDEAGRIIHWYHQIPDFKKTKFMYDLAGQLGIMIDRKGKVTTYTYHNIGYLKTIQYPQWNNGVDDIDGKLVCYQKYDYLGRVLTVTDSEVGGSQEFIYDKSGNLVQRFDPDRFGLSFYYDDDDRFTGAENINSEFKVEFLLDNIGRVKNVNDSSHLDGSASWEYKYEKIVNGQKKVINLYERKLLTLNLISQFDYDEKNRLIYIHNEWSTPVPIDIYTRTITYRDDDLIKEITGEDSNKFRYDNIKQLLFESDGNYSSDYDKAGNRIYRIDRSIIPNPLSNTYRDPNQLVNESSSPPNFSYDENGNLHMSPYPINPTEFFFDGMNCLRFIKNNQFEISYLYDKDYKLIERKVYDVASESLENTNFSYLFTKPIFIRRNDNSHLLLTWDDNGTLLRIRNYQAIAGGTLQNSIFPIYNGLGGITHFVDSAQNSLVQVKYDAWGTIINLVDNHKLFEFWGYRGCIYDKLTNNLLFGKRWYNSIIGRWCSEDPLINLTNSKFAPIIEEGSNLYRSIDIALNLYRYSRNDPVNFFDPTGLRDRPWPINGKIINLSKDFVIGVSTDGKGKVYAVPGGTVTPNDEDIDFVYVDNKWFKISMFNYRIGPKGSPDPFPFFELADKKELKAIDSAIRKGDFVIIQEGIPHSDMINGPREGWQNLRSGGDPDIISGE